MFQVPTRALLIAVTAGALAFTAACGSDAAPAASNTPAATTEAMTSEAMTSDAMTDSTMAPSAMVGAGCAAYAAANPSGGASVEGMAAENVTTAASNNPLLKTLVAAVSGEVNPDVNLVSTLNSADFTVFAPVDDAFAKIDADTMATLGTDADLLSSILTYHVLPGKIAPDAIVGTHTTVQGADLEVTGSGDDLKVNGESTVICGGVQTKNAIVYLIDTVLMPPATDAPMTSEAMTSEAMTSDAMTSDAMTDATMAPAAMVGAGCAAYAAANPSGGASVEGMAAENVTTAASNNPLLKTLVAAVSGQVNPDVNLVSTLNSTDFTVFAPVDDAFAKIDADTMATLGTDADLLTSILTYHVLPGKIAPDAIVGTHTTVQGADLEVTGSGDDLKVNGESTVICGGVQTKNATVYLIDTVLMPPAAR